jgi:hypothetical protein
VGCNPSGDFILGSGSCRYKQNFLANLLWIILLFREEDVKEEAAASRHSAASPDGHAALREIESAA